MKIDQTEAFRPIRAFGGTIAGISAIALLVAAGLAFALARSLTRPILALQEGAARFGRGELDVRLNDVSRDELGQLAAEFNRMAEALAEQQRIKVIQSWDLEAVLGIKLPSVESPAVEEAFRFKSKSGLTGVPPEAGLRGGAERRGPGYVDD